MSLPSKSAAWLAVVLVACLCGLGLTHWRGRNVGIRDPDEVAWVLASAIVHKVGAPSDPPWLEREAVSHPPLVKLLFAAVMPREDIPPSLAAKEQWLTDQWNVPRAGELFARDAALVSRVALQRTRLVGLLFTGLALVLASLLAWEAFSPRAAMLTALLLAVSPTVHYLAGLAVSDSVFCALLLATAYAVVRFRRATDRTALVWALAVGVCAGLAAQSKLTGFACLGVAGLCILRDGSARWARALPALPAFLVTCCVVNPAMFMAPLTWLRGALDLRVQYIELQGQIFYAESFPMPVLRLAAFVRELFYRSDLLYAATPLDASVLAAGIALGLLWLTRDKAEPLHLRAPLLVHAAAWTLLSYVGFPVAWPRYVLPALFFLAPVAGAGLAALPSLWRHRSARVRAALAVAVAVVFPLVSARLTTENYYANHPEEEDAARLTRARAVLQLYPDDAVVKTWAQDQGVPGG